MIRKPWYVKNHRSIFVRQINQPVRPCVSPSFLASSVEFVQKTTGLFSYVKKNRPGRPCVSPSFLAYRSAYELNSIWDPIGRLLLPTPPDVLTSSGTVDAINELGHTKLLTPSTS
jgi:hypothetical protein